MGIFSDQSSFEIFWSFHEDINQPKTTHMYQGNYFEQMCNAIKRDLTEHGYCWFIDKCIMDPLFRNQENMKVISKTYLDLSGEMTFSDIYTALRFLKDYPWKFHIADVQSSTETSTDKVINVSNDIQEQLEKQNLLLKEEISKLRQENEAFKNASDSIRAAAQQDAERIRAEARKILEEAKHTREMLSRSVVEEVTEEALIKPSGERLTKEDVERQVQALEKTLWDMFDSVRNEVMNMTTDFRYGLYRDESRKLCSAFIKLNKFATEYLDKQADSIADILKDDETKILVRDCILKIQGHAIKLVKEFESGMKYLEFAIVRPKTGEAYVPGEHLLAIGNDDGSLEGAIKDCLSPGVKTSSGIIEAAGVTVEPY